MPLLLFFVFIVAPAVELFVIVKVGQAIGLGWTLLLLVAAAALGIYVMRRAGASWWGALRGRTETVDGVVVTAPKPDPAGAGRAALLFLAGLLLLLPGFISDVVGLVLLVPWVRSLLAAATAAWFTRRFTAVSGPGGVRLWTRTTGRVVPGQVVRDDSPPGASGPPPETRPPGELPPA